MNMPQRSDEALLWAAVDAGETARAAGERLGIHHRRVDYLCEKWTRQGRYDYGVCVDLGWPVRAEDDPRRDVERKAAREQVDAWHQRITRAINTPYDVASRIHSDMLMHGSAYVRDDGNGGWEHVPHDKAHPAPVSEPLRGMLGKDGVLEEHLRRSRPPRGYVEEVAAYVPRHPTPDDGLDPWEEVQKVAAKHLPDPGNQAAPWTNERAEEIVRRIAEGAGLRHLALADGRGYGKTVLGDALRTDPDSFTMGAVTPPPGDVLADIRRAMTLAREQYDAHRPAAILAAPDVPDALADAFPAEAWRSPVPSVGTWLRGIPVEVDDTLPPGYWRVETAEQTRDRHERADRRAAHLEEGAAS